MKSSQKDKTSNEVGVELKYCEHCGGLWVRERGTGVVLREVSAKGGGLTQSEDEIEPANPAGASAHGDRGLRI
jgi:Zn-finger nucleic acid-binding protein